MGIFKHLNFAKASKVIKAGQQDVKRPKATVTDIKSKQQKKQGGSKK